MKRSGGDRVALDGAEEGASWDLSYSERAPAEIPAQAELGRAALESTVDRGF